MIFQGITPLSQPGIILASRTVVGTLTTETVTGNRRSRSSTGWVLTIYESWGTRTISSHSSTSSDTGGSIAALVDGSFGTYQFTRSINAAGQGTSGWSGTQAKRMESSGEWSDSGPDDETTYESITTQAIDDDWTNEVTEHHETTRYGGVDQEPYSFTTQDTYETDYETQRQTAEDTLGPHIAANQVGAALATGLGVVAAHTNYNGNGFGNAGTGSGSVQPDTGSGSGSGYSGPETGPLPDGGYWEKFDDGSYWYYAEYDDGHNLTYWEDGHHETFSINTALNAAQGAGSGAGEAVDAGVKTQELTSPQLPPDVGDMNSESFRRSGRNADGTYWIYVDDDDGWVYSTFDKDGKLLHKKTGKFGFFAQIGRIYDDPLEGDKRQSSMRRKYSNLAKNSHQNHNKHVNKHVNAMRNTPTYDTTHGNFENGVAAADVGYRSGDGEYTPALETAPATIDYLPANSFGMNSTDGLSFIDGAAEDLIRFYGGNLSLLPKEIIYFTEGMLGGLSNVLFYPMGFTLTGDGESQTDDGFENPYWEGVKGAGRGLKDGSLMIINHLTLNSYFGWIDASGIPLDYTVQKSIKENGGLYGTADGFARTGAHALHAAGLIKLGFSLGIFKEFSLLGTRTTGQFPIHFAFQAGSGTKWLHFAGDWGKMRLLRIPADTVMAFHSTRFLHLTGIPILSVEGATASATAWTCLSGAGGAFARGWIPDFLRRLF
jgi:hypothetical protein